MSNVKKMTRTAVRQFMQQSLFLRDMRLADLQVFPGTDLATALMVSKNHIPYEVNFGIGENGVEIIDAAVLFKAETPERFDFMGKEVRK